LVVADNSVKDLASVDDSDGDDENPTATDAILEANARKKNTDGSIVAKPHILRFLLLVLLFMACIVVKPDRCRLVRT